MKFYSGVGKIVCLLVVLLAFAFALALFRRPSECLYSLCFPSHTSPDLRVACALVYGIIGTRVFDAFYPRRCSRCKEIGEYIDKDEQP